MEPRVSIGLPVYNGERYLAETIEALSAQSYDNYDLIISDNASTDRTQSICLDYSTQDRRIRYYRNETNLGAAPNFNRVFELSSSEYFKWAAYDDLIAPDFLAKCVEVLDDNPSVVLCFSQAELIDEDGQFLGTQQFKADTSVARTEVRFRNLILTPDTGWQAFGLTRAEAVRKTMLHGSYPASDLVLLAELALYGQFYEIHETLLFPRYHANQGTNLIPVERDRVSFFDTSMTDRIVLPKWKYLNGYLQAIRRSPLSYHEKLYCYPQVLRWALKPDHFRALGKDVVLAINQFSRRSTMSMISRDKTSKELPQA